MDPIKFYGTVAKAQTMVDGGLRIWLDLPETAIMQFAELIACKQHEQVLDFEVTAHLGVTDCNDETEKSPERSGPEVDRKRITIRRDK
jgi:hypothetical protein